MQLLDTVDTCHEGFNDFSETTVGPHKIIVTWEMLLNWTVATAWRNRQILWPLGWSRAAPLVPSCLLYVAIYIQVLSNPINWKSASHISQMSSAQQPHVANAYYAAPHRYSTFPPSQKGSLDHNRLHTRGFRVKEMGAQSQESFPYRRMTLRFWERWLWRESQEKKVFWVSCLRYWIFKEVVDPCPRK